MAVQATARWRDGWVRSRVMPRRRPTERDVRLAILRLQWSAYENLRSAVANGALFVAFFGGWAATLDAALIPTAVAGVLGGLCGVGYYLTRGSRYPLARRLLAVAAILTVAGVAWAVAVAVVADV